MKIDREFRSEVGWSYHLLILVLSVTTILAFVRGGSPMGMILLLLVTMLCIHILRSTWYRITADDELLLHCSLFPEKRVAIARITAVEPTVNFLSSYALSLNRLMIWVDGKPWMLISPVNRAAFIKQLLAVNPAIEVRE